VGCAGRADAGTLNPTSWVQAVPRSDLQNPLRQAGARVRAPRLDRGTLLVQRQAAAWEGCLFPDAEEGTIWRYLGGGELEEASDFGPRVRVRLAPERSVADPLPLKETGQGGQGDPPRVLENVERSRRRAKGRLRRFAVANHLDRMATLTYSDEYLPASRAEAVRDYHEFVRRLREVYGRRALVRVIERGSLRDRRHHHVALGFYIPKAQLAALWGRGFVDVRQFRRRRRDGRSASRQVASYISAYIDKQPEAGPGEHRYEPTEGFSPRRVTVYGPSADDVYRELIRRMGGEVPGFESWSETWPEYRGPPAAFVSW